MHTLQSVKIFYVSLFHVSDVCVCAHFITNNPRIQNFCCPVLTLWFPKILSLYLIHYGRDAQSDPPRGSDVLFKILSVLAWFLDAVNSSEIWWHPNSRNFLSSVISVAVSNY